MTGSDGLVEPRRFGHLARAITIKVEAEPVAAEGAAEVAPAAVAEPEVVKKGKKEEAAPAEESKEKKKK